jgi:hypothetical protein
MRLGVQAYQGQVSGAGSFTSPPVSATAFVFSQVTFAHAGDLAAWVFESVSALAFSDRSAFASLHQPQGEATCIVCSFEPNRDYLRAIANRGQPSDGQSNGNRRSCRSIPRFCRNDLGLTIDYCRDGSVLVCAPIPCVMLRSPTTILQARRSLGPPMSRPAGAEARASWKFF